MAETADIAVIDGEDAGSTPWEFDSVSGDFALSAAAAIHGSNGYAYTPTAAISGRGYESYSGQSSVYARFYIKPVSSNLSGIQYVLHRCIWDGGVDLISIRIYGGSGTGMGYIVYFRHNGGEIPVYSRQSNQDLVFGNSYRIEVHWKAGAIGTGGYSVWFDGDLKASDYTTYATNNYSADGSTLGFWSGTSNTSVIYFDDFVLSTTGPIGEYPPGGDRLMARFPAAYRSVQPTGRPTGKG